MISLVLTGLLRGIRTQRALVLENLALRHQLAVLRRSTPRPRLRPSDRLFWILLSRLWHGWAEAVAIVRPETVIRWHRTGFRLFWTWKSQQRGPGRPAVAPGSPSAPRRMAEANPLWGAPRIHGGAPEARAAVGSAYRLSGFPMQLRGNPLRLPTFQTVRHTEEIFTVASYVGRLPAIQCHIPTLAPGAFPPIRSQGCRLFVRHAA
jgi:hypothetical protein